MHLLDKCFNCFEKDEKLRSLNGCIARICVSTDPLEIVRFVGFANDYVSMLAQSRILELKSDNVDLNG